MMIMAPSSPTRSSSSSPKIRATLTVADTAAWYCSIIIVSLILVIALLRDTYPADQGDAHASGALNMKGSPFVERPCDEIYVVGEGETLHTISDKCGDPYIVERNPHIHDPDDVFPGLVIRIMPLATSKSNT